jgi:dipeptidyl-peptidase 4
MRNLKILLLIIIVFTIVPAWGAQDFQTPAESNKFQTPSTYFEMLNFIHSLQKQTPYLKVYYYGISVNGKSLPLVILSNPPLRNPQEAICTGKPIILIQSQVHGNEPAGKEAALILMRDIALGDKSSYLEHLIFLFAPQLNPDGSETYTRRSAANLDLNRDYMKLDSPEITALVHNVVDLWHPHLIIDAHEAKARPQELDFMFESCRHPNTAPELLAFAEKEVVPCIREALIKANFKIARYFIKNYQEKQTDLSYESGGVYPSSARNYEGLENSVGLLFESVIPKDHSALEKRVNCHLIAMQAVIAYIYEHYEGFLKLVNGARLNAQKNPKAPIIVEVKKVSEDKETAHKALIVKDRITPEKSIALPSAYLLPQVALPLIRKLLAHRIDVEMLLSSETLEVEGYQITGLESSPKNENGHLGIKYEIKPVIQNIFLPPGSFIVPVNQDRGYLAAMLLEPESQDCLWREGLLSSFLEKGTVLPVYRMMRKAFFKSQIIMEP